MDTEKYYYVDQLCFDSIADLGIIVMLGNIDNPKKEIVLHWQAASIDGNSVDIFSKTWHDFRTEVSTDCIEVCEAVLDIFKQVESHDVDKNDPIAFIKILEFMGYKKAVYSAAIKNAFYGG